MSTAMYQQYFGLREMPFSLTPDTSNAFSITPGTATRLAFTVQPTATAATSARTVLMLALLIENHLCIRVWFSNLTNQPAVNR